MILIIDVYKVPAKKIIDLIYPGKKFEEIKENENTIFKTLYEIKSNEPQNFFLRSESFESFFLTKLKYYFDEICEISESVLKITDKKKREIRIYDIIQNEKGIKEFRLITDTIEQKNENVSTSKTIKPYLEAQEDEIVLFPSDEE